MKRGDVRCFVSYGIGGFRIKISRRVSCFGVAYAKSWGKLSFSRCTWPPQTPLWQQEWHIHLYSVQHKLLGRWICHKIKSKITHIFQMHVRRLVRDVEIKLHAFQDSLFYIEANLKLQVQTSLTTGKKTFPTIYWRGDWMGPWIFLEFLSSSLLSSNKL